MPEPLKNLYNQEFIRSLCCILKYSYTPFDSVKFTSYIFDKKWESRELKQRMRHITESIHKFLPLNFPDSLNVLKSASQNHGGFEYMFLPDYVELYGLNNFDESISALEYFTKHSSSEFAVRPFIKKYNREMMLQMEKWAESKNHHVRRLSSEGCRPRLPWAMALPEFKKDPRPVLKILNKLKNDESEYVRRSVANNLNDISKDNPQMVVEIARKWKGRNEQTDWIIKHGCRTLLKQGNSEIMKLFGLKKPNHINFKNFKTQTQVNLGGNIEFSFTLKSLNAKLGKLRIEYGIDFVRKNGTLSRKLFKISESSYSCTEKTVIKRHSFKPITTRKHYTGTHGLAIIINGQEIGFKNFILKD